MRNLNPSDIDQLLSIKVGFPLETSARVSACAFLELRWSDRTGGIRLQGMIIRTSSIIPDLQQVNLTAPVAATAGPIIHGPPVTASPIRTQRPRQPALLSPGALRVP
jgi:hypothetical protein